MQVEPEDKESRGQEAEAEACHEEASQVKAGGRAVRRASQAEPGRRAPKTQESEEFPDPRLHEA